MKLLPGESCTQFFTVSNCIGDQEDGTQVKSLNRWMTHSGATRSAEKSWGLVLTTPKEKNFILLYIQFLAFFSGTLFGFEFFDLGVSRNHDRDNSYIILREPFKNYLADFVR